MGLFELLDILKSMCEKVDNVEVMQASVQDIQGDMSTSAIRDVFIKVDDNTNEFVVLLLTE